MNVVQIGYGFDDDLASPEALLARYATLTGWSDALVGAGARVTVVHRFHRDGRLAQNGVDYIFQQAGRAGRPFWSRSARLRRVLAALRPDIAHVNGLNFPMQTWLLRRALPAPAALVVQDHATGAPAERGSPPIRSLRRFVRRSAMRAPDGFLFAAAEQAEPWRRAGLIAAHQGVYPVMEASTNLRPMPRAEARAKSSVDGTPAVLWVGRLNSNKDPLAVLGGFERALGDLPDAALTMIYGADDLLPAVRDRLRRSAALAQRVRLIGHVPRDRMAAFYSAADIFALGSHHEGSGYSVIEACACGLSPVVTDIPTFRVITAGGSFGALWTPGDAASCAAALVGVARRDLSSERRRIGDHFDRALSWPAVGRRAMTIYEDVVARRRGRS